MGGRGGSSGISSQHGAGQVVIHKQPEPNKQGYKYYMTGKRDVISNWDDEKGTYELSPKEVKMFDRVQKIWYYYLSRKWFRKENTRKREAPVDNPGAC